VKVDKVFEPQEENRRVYDSLFHSYQEAYRSLRRFYKRLNEKRS
jgi:sugar (pentulose or hexulose) kinase